MRILALEGELAKAAVCRCVEADLNWPAACRTPRMAARVERLRERTVPAWQAVDNVARARQDGRTLKRSEADGALE